MSWMVDEEEQVVTKLIVKQVRSAFQECGGEELTPDQFYQALRLLDLTLTPRQALTFFTFLDPKESGKVGWNVFYKTLQKGMEKWKGLPLLDVIGGLLMEFHATNRGRQLRNNLSIANLPQNILAEIVKEDPNTPLQTPLVSSMNNNNNNNHNNNTLSLSQINGNNNNPLPKYWNEQLLNNSGKLSNKLTSWQLQNRAKYRELKEKEIKKRLSQLTKNKKIIINQINLYIQIQIQIQIKNLKNINLKKS